MRLRLHRLIGLILCISLRAGAQTPPFLHAGDQSLLHFSNGNYSFTYHVMMTGNDHNPNNILFLDDTLVAYTLNGQLFDANLNLYPGNTAWFHFGGAGGHSQGKGYFSYMIPLNNQQGMIVNLGHLSPDHKLMFTKFNWQNKSVLFNNVPKESFIAHLGTGWPYYDRTFPLWKSSEDNQYYGIVADTASHTQQVPNLSMHYALFSIDMNGNYHKLWGSWSPYSKLLMKHHLRFNLVAGFEISVPNTSVTVTNGDTMLTNPPRAFMTLDHIDPMDTIWDEIMRIRVPVDLSANSVTGQPYWLSFNFRNNVIDFLLSPSARFLYTIYKKVNGEHRLVRYDLSLADTNQIYHQMETLYHFPPSNWLNGWKPSALQFGPDHEILVAMDRTGSQINSYLGLIPYPDSTIHGFDPFFLSKGNSDFGYFSNYMISDTRKPEFSLTHWCQDSVSFRTRYTAMLDSVRWDFGDPASGASNSSNLLHPSHSYSTHGKFFVQWKGYQYGFASEWSDTVQVLPVPEVKLPADTLLCTDDMLLLEVQQGFPANYLWQDGSTDSVYLATTPGTYWVQISSDSCGSVSDTLVLRYTQKPEISLRDTLLCEEDFTVLSVSAPLAQYQWNTGSTDSSIYAAQMGLYSVIASNPCGADTAFARIETRPCDCKLYIPQAFTPDGNGKNEQFSIVSNCSDMRWELIVYNRWGEPIAQLNQENPFWNGQNKGQAVPPGVYQYSLRYHFPESQPVGYSFDKVHYGEIVLIR